MCFFVPPTLGQRRLKRRGGPEGPASLRWCSSLADVERVTGTGWRGVRGAERVLGRATLIYAVRVSVERGALLAVRASRAGRVLDAVVALVRVGAVAVRDIGRSEPARRGQARRHAATTGADRGLAAVVVALVVADTRRRRAARQGVVERVRAGHAIGQALVVRARVAVLAVDVRRAERQIHRLGLARVRARVAPVERGGETVLARVKQAWITERRAIAVVLVHGPVTVVVQVVVTGHGLLRRDGRDARLTHVRLAGVRVRLDCSVGRLTDLDSLDDLRVRSLRIFARDLDRRVFVSLDRVFANFRPCDFRVIDDTNFGVAR